MELYDVMRTTFAAREFTDDPLPDDVLSRIFDNARFAPSGGNRQGAHITVVRDADVRRRLAELGTATARRYFAQLTAGENPWNSVYPSEVPQEVIDSTEIPDTFTAPIINAPVVLVFTVDLSAVASVDQNLDRVGLASGASVYPLIWNILLAARNEGYGGTITTMAIAQEDQVRRLLGIPDNHADRRDRAARQTDTTADQTAPPADRGVRHRRALRRPSAQGLMRPAAPQSGKRRIMAETSPTSTWLITGCSTGLGRALAEAVIGAGHNAVVTARDATKVADLAEAAPERVLAAALDVTDPEQVGSVVRQAEERFGGVDVLVNNAGYGYRAAVEEGDDADVRTLFETHFFGTVAMIKAVLPGMRSRRSGAIVNLSSIGAQLTPVGSGYYAAAKAALEGLSGALRGELAPLGISVTVVEPGAFRTDFAGRSLVQSATVIDDYASTAGQRRKENDTMHGNQAGDPAKAGAAIIAAVESSEPPAFLLLGPDALAAYRYIADRRASEIANWETLTTGTDFDA